MLVIPGTEEDTRLFLQHAPNIGTVVLDTLDMAFRGLRTRVTPSAIVVAVDGTITASFAPPDGWPLTAEVLRTGSELGDVQPTEGG